MRNEAAVGPIATTFSDSAVAPVGIEQLPLLPQVGTVNVSPAVSGVGRLPTLMSPGRVSNNRHGVIGTSADAPGLEAVATVAITAAPVPAATSAATANRARDVRRVTPENRPRLARIVHHATRPEC